MSGSSVQLNSRGHLHFSRFVSLSFEACLIRSNRLSLVANRFRILSHTQTENEWSYISDDAKDLIQHLLVKDASQRYTADMVLKHRWVAQGGSFTPLETPSIMRKNNSYKDLAACVGGANAIKRLVLYQQNLSSDFKSTLEQCVGSYKDNSSSLVLTGDSSPTFDLHFTSDEDAFLSDLDQAIAESIEKCPSAVEQQQPEQQQQPKRDDQPPQPQQQSLPAITGSARKIEMKSVKWVDLQEQDEEDFSDDASTTPARLPATAIGVDKKIDTPLKSALKSSVDRAKQPETSKPPVRLAEIKKKRKKTIQKANRKNGSTTSSSTSSSDESSDYNNNAIDEGEDADIDEVDNDDSTAVGGQPQPGLAAHHQQTNRTNLQKMLECIENRKRLSSASCYVISNVKNKQTASLNFCPNMKSMLII